MEDTRVIVKFLQNVDMYMAGERAAFLPHIAQEMARPDRRLVQILGPVGKNDTNAVGMVLGPDAPSDAGPASPKKFTKATP